MNKRSFGRQSEKLIEVAMIYDSTLRKKALEIDSEPYQQLLSLFCSSELDKRGRDKNNAESSTILSSLEERNPVS
ncbi:hypothetical protein RRG08_041742 [Elysia crispata]|uniref:Uncharacterized protein n=1 Tax=Elysia crispata TaxID=231223 RepID=A0AAE0YYW0_9GAST|nr:hypothetical protein RRG08_041742 [Elysia crispata]